MCGKHTSRIIYVRGERRTPPLKILDTGQTFLDFFLTTHKNINGLVSVSYESPVCRKSFQTLFTVRLPCKQATWIFVLQANCVRLTSDLREQRCGRLWLTIYLLTIDTCSVPHRAQYSDCWYNNASNLCGYNAVFLHWELPRSTIRTAAIQADQVVVWRGIFYIICLCYMHINF
jgi:hypothetical protein